MAKKPPRKPTGSISQAYIDIEEGKPVRLEVSPPYKLPEEKAAAEAEVMAKLLDVCLKNPNFFSLAGYSAIPDEGRRTPDFSIVMADGSSGFAELVEIAPLGRGGYEVAARVRNVGDFLDFALGLIKVKQKKYGGGEFAPMHLIAYVSDDRFLPDPRQTKALRSMINSDGRLTAFETVHLMLFAHDGSPLAVKLWPFASEMSGAEVAQIRSEQLIRPDYGKSVITESKWSGKEFDATLRVYLPTGAKHPPFNVFANRQDALSTMMPDIRTRILPKKRNSLF